MKSVLNLHINIGDPVLDDLAEDKKLKVGFITDFFSHASTPFPFVVCWNDGYESEYDENEILEMKAAYEKHKA